MNIELLKDPCLIWFLIGLFCIVAEFVIPGVIIIFFAFGAWVVAILMFLTDINILLQIIIFLSVSLLSIIFVRKYLMKDDLNLPDITDDFSDKIAVVQQDFEKGTFGTVLFKGAIWKAQTESNAILKKGDYVKIVGKDSIVLQVQPIDK